VYLAVTWIGRPISPRRGAVGHSQRRLFIVSVGAPTQLNHMSVVSVRSMVYR